MNTSFSEVVSRAAASIRDSSGRSPAAGVVLGSGLSDVVDDLFGDTPVDTIPYSTIEGFGGPSVSGHRGTLSISDDAAVMAGRFHWYEGRSIDDVVLPIATLAACGVTTVIVTNAAGGINGAYAPGDLVLITDHLNLMGVNPLIGPQDPSSVARFIDMTTAYDSGLRDIAHAIDSELKEGVYAALSGPNYETPAEIRMLRTLGADLVGMSTVPEVLVARSYGMRVLGISTVTNLAAGMSGRPLDHREVVEVGRSIRSRMAALLTRLIAEIGA